MNHAVSKLSRRGLTALAALGGLGLLAPRAQAQPSGFWGRHGAERGSPEQMAQRMVHRIDRLIKTVNGTPEQREKLMQLAKTAAADMQPLREQHMAARQRGMALLAAPSIDRSAMERLRQDQLKLADAMSQRMLRHMADAAEVFTPAQRTVAAQTLREHLKQRGPRGA
jgi:periplasmic protein CpxP/Spy